MFSLVLLAVRVVLFGVILDQPYALWPGIYYSCVGVKILEHF